MASQNYHDEDVIEDQILHLSNGRKTIFTRRRKLKNNNCAWLTVHIVSGQALNRELIRCVCFGKNSF